MLYDFNKYILIKSNNVYHTFYLYFILLSLVLKLFRGFYLSFYSSTFSGIRYNVPMQKYFQTHIFKYFKITNFPYYHFFYHRILFLRVTNLFFSECKHKEWNKPSVVAALEYLSGKQNSRLNLLLLKKALKHFTFQY